MQIGSLVARETIVRRLGILAILIAVALTILLPILPGCGEDRTIIRALTFSPDGQRLAVSRIDRTDCNMIEVVRVRRRTHGCLVDVPSATVKASLQRICGSEIRVRVFCLRDGRRALAFAADGRSLFVLEFGGGEIDRFDLDSGQATTFFNQKPDREFSLFRYRRSKSCRGCKLKLGCLAA